MPDGEEAYYVGRHPDQFRSGQPALIQGVRIVNDRPCFYLRYADGATDCTPIEDEDFVGKGGLGVFYDIVKKVPST
jgi:hypothetical protein